MYILKLIVMVSAAGMGSEPSLMITVGQYSTEPTCQIDGALLVPTVRDEYAPIAARIGARLDRVIVNCVRMK